MKAWVACAVDGEGSIFTTNCGKCPQLHWRIQMPNTNRAYMERFCDLVGVEYRYIKTVTNGAGKGIRPLQHWIYRVLIIKESDVKRILTEILPFLIIKRELAEQALNALR